MSELSKLAREAKALGFPVEQTHATPLAATSKVVLDSRELGWKNAYASLTAGRVWSGRVAPIDHCAVVYCLRGVNRVERRIEGEARLEVVDFKPRELAFFPTHAAATFDVRGGADVLVVYLRGAMVRDVAERGFGVKAQALHFRPAMAFHDPLLEQLCLSFASALERQEGPRDSYYIDHLAETIAAHGLRHYNPLETARKAPAPAPLGASVRSVCDWAEARLDDDLGLERLAKQARMTPAALTQAFRETLDVTPHQWVLARRVERAARMISDTNRPLAEIALETGFASQSHLSTMFKRQMGQTPQGYRQGR